MLCFYMMLEKQNGTDLAHQKKPIFLAIKFYLLSNQISIFSRCLWINEYMWTGSQFHNNCNRILNWIHRLLWLWISLSVCVRQRDISMNIIVPFYPFDALIYELYDDCWNMNIYFVDFIVWIKNHDYSYYDIWGFGVHFQFDFCNLDWKNVKRVKNYKFTSHTAWYSNSIKSFNLFPALLEELIFSQISVRAENSLHANCN